MSAKHMMTKVGQFLRNRWVITTIGWLALALLIWFGGPLIAIAGHELLATPVARLAVLLVLAIGWGISLLLMQSRQRRSSAKVVQTLLTDESEQSQDPVVQKEISELKKRIQQALEILKSARFNRGRSVYQLPWYVLIGPPGSGKTTALNNSGLQFPLQEQLGQDALAGIGGTRHCDWWFTDQAVLIDTAGRYTTQDSHAQQDGRAWQGFLGLLKKYRPRRPLNGALISISIADLLRQTRTERNLHARAIKHRLQELQHQLGMRFPVYVMFTKADLVAGFSEYFADLDEEARQQIWGFTFDPAAELDEKGAISGFNKQFHGLLSRLQQGLSERLQQEREPKARALIYEFPKQLRLLQAAADDLLREVFTPNAFEEAPMIRGVYIVSATQEGMPIDRVMAQTAGGLGLDAMPIGQSSTDGKAFFIRNLFEQVIFPEQNIGSGNRHHERQRRWLQHGAIAASAALLVVSSLLWWASYHWNAGLIDQSHAAVQAYQSLAEREDVAEGDVFALVDLLNALKALPAGEDGVGLQRDGIKGWGLYQGDKIAQPAVAAYQRGLRLYFAPYLEKLTREQMAAHEEHLEYLYESLKTYLMLFDESHRDEEQLRGWFSHYVEHNYRGELNQGVRSALLTHFDQLLGQGLYGMHQDDSAVERARDRLTQMSLAERAYQRLRSEFMQSQIPDFRFTEVLGTDSLRIFSRRSGLPMNKGVPGLYTYNGFHGIFQVESKRILKRLTEDSWVYGEERVKLGNTDLDKLTADIRLKYYRDYIHEWETLLGDIELQAFSSPKQGEAILEVLTGPEQPIVSMITATQKELQLTRMPGGENAEAAAQAAGKVADVALSRQQSRLSRYLPDEMPAIALALPGAEVEAAFDELLKLGESDMQQMQQTLKGAERYLTSMAERGRDRTAFESQQQGSELALALQATRRAATKLPAPVNQWIGTISHQNDQLARQGSQSLINNAWKNEVLAEYRAAIKGRYPFDRTANREVTLKDFGRFFGYDGTLDRFFNQYLAPFVDRSQRRWRFSKNIGVSAETLAAFQQADAIRKQFFEAGGQQPNVEFSLTVRTLHRHISQLLLELDGQSLSYRHGPTRLYQFQWPGAPDKAATRITLIPPKSGRSISQTYRGNWGWFRLLDDAVKNRPQSRQDNLLLFAMNGYDTEIEMIPGSVNHPFWSKELERFSCPSRL